MSLKPALIQGGRHIDHRSTLTFLNEFDMSEVKRFYIIQNKDIEVIRAWRAHKIEQRWFYPIHGSFLVRIIEISDFEFPETRLPIEDYLLSDENNQILHIPGGYATSVQATTTESKMLVFADYGIENSNLDDYLYPQDYFGK